MHLTWGRFWHKNKLQIKRISQQATKNQLRRDWGCKRSRIEQNVVDSSNFGKRITLPNKASEEWFHEESDIWAPDVLIWGRRNRGFLGIQANYVLILNDLVYCRVCALPMRHDTRLGTNSGAASLKVHCVSEGIQWTNLASPRLRIMKCFQQVTKNLNLEGKWNADFHSNSC